MTDQSTINGIVWKACDTFRGTLNSSQYKDYILTMLFVKYLSDSHKEKVEELKAKYNGNEERIKRALEKGVFILDEECSFDKLYSQKDEDNIGEIINRALLKIEDDNFRKLSGVFKNIDFNSEANLGKTKERNTLLRTLLEDFNNPDLDLRPSKLKGNDVIGDAYEYLIAMFADDSGKKGGEFFTPSEVSTVVAKLVNPKEGDRIYDPTCGSGSLLIKASKEVGNTNFAIYGQEKNGATESLAKMNMFLHNINDAKIEWGDTIRNPLHVENDHIMKFDVIVANPPFSLDKWGYEEAEHDKFGRFSYGIPPKSKGDYAFVQHMVASMNENGRVAVVLPLGVLFRGASEGKIRKGFIEENLLDAVIGLPSNLFFGVSIPACILVFKKNKATNDILFIDASNEFLQGKNQNKLTKENIDKIIDTYRERKVIEKYSHIATLDEIQENDYNLNIPRYVDTFEEEEAIDVPKVQGKIEELNKELTTLEEKMKAFLKELNLEGDNNERD